MVDELVATLVRGAVAALPSLPQAGSGGGRSFDNEVSFAPDSKLIPCHFAGSVQHLSDQRLQRVARILRRERLDLARRRRPEDPVQSMQPAAMAP